MTYFAQLKTSLHDFKMIWMKFFSFTLFSIADLDEYTDLVLSHLSLPVWPSPAPGAYLLCHSLIFVLNYSNMLHNFKF